MPSENGCRAGGRSLENWRPPGPRYGRGVAGSRASASLAVTSAMPMIAINEGPARSSVKRRPSSRISMGMVMNATISKVVRKAAAVVYDAPESTSEAISGMPIMFGIMATVPATAAITT